MPTIPLPEGALAPAPNDVPYVAVEFQLGASIYMIPGWTALPELHSSKQLLASVHEAVNDAIEDGHDVALLITPLDAAAGKAAPTKLRAARYEATGRRIVGQDCPVCIYGQISDEDKRIRGFLTMPEDVPALSVFLKSIGAIVGDANKLN